METVWEEFEDNKAVIRIYKLKKDKLHNGQKKNDNDLQITTKKTKDWVTRTHWKPGVNSGALEG